MAGAFIRTAGHEIIRVGEHPVRLFDRSEVSLHVVLAGSAEPRVDELADQLSPGDATCTSNVFDGS